MEDDKASVEFVFDWRGILFVVVFFILSLVMIYLGYALGNSGILMWGIVFLMSSILALIPISARLVAPKIIADRLRQMELEAAIKEKIKKYQEKGSIASENTNTERIESKY